MENETDLALTGFVVAAVVIDWFAVLLMAIFETRLFETSKSEKQMRSYVFNKFNLYTPMI